MTHVLIVEDHEENRTLLKMLLEANGYRVTAAGDGLEALAAARRDPPDAVISDVLMPKLDGFALCRAWMQDERLRGIPFIFYSATNVRAEDKEFGLTLGAARYLIRPLEAEVVLRELRAVLEQWAGPAAPAPLEDVIFHTLHGLALARKLEDKIAQLEAANRKLQENEARFRSLTEMSSDFYWESDAEHRIMARGSANKELDTATTSRGGAQIGERRWEIPYFSPDEAGWAAHRAVLDAHQPFRNFELSRLGTDGVEHFVSISGDPVFDAAGVFTGYRGVGTDITERKAAEAKIRRLTQLYAALSQCNEAIVRCASEKELFPQICRVAVEFGGMKTAWIGLMDEASQQVKPVAAYGEGIENLEGVRISVDAGSAFGHGLVGTAMRENQPVWCQDYLNDPRTAPWHERAARAGWGSMATVPLRRNGVVIGAFALLSGEVNPFDEAARELLVEMAIDIDFALDNFHREAERARAEKDLRAAEEQFRGLVEQSIAGIYIIQDDKLAYVNRRYAEILGYDSADDLIGRHRLFMVPETDRAAVTERILRQFEGRLNVAYDFSGVRKDGSTIEVGAHGARATHEGRPAVIGLMQDISEKKRAEAQIQRYIAQIENAFMSTVQVVTTLGEMRDPYTAGHQRRVAEIAVAIGAELGFDAQRQEGLRVAGYLHDIGKMRIPSEILSKPGELSPIEFRLVQGHARASYDVLKDIQFPWPVAEVAWQHHERMDGSGYPQGLKGEAILLEARIVVVANKIDALCSHRPYRPGMGIDKALAEIERGRGSAYDLEVVHACLHLFRERGFQLPV
jgi:PAS domain S-box-containing protein